jgi:hypothetical protein
MLIALMALHYLYKICVSSLGTNKSEKIVYISSLKLCLFILMSLFYSISSQPRHWHA